jgi:hypothetical protein
MIKFLYKVIHYEPTADHKTNVSRSFLLITTLIITLPISILYLLYNGINGKTLLTDIFFLGIALALIAIVYFFIRKIWKSYLRDTLSYQYYNFGKYNTLFKTLIVLLLVGFIIFIGRLFAFFLQ